MLTASQQWQQPGAHAPGAVPTLAETIVLPESPSRTWEASEMDLKQAHERQVQQETETAYNAAIQRLARLKGQHAKAEDILAAEAETDRALDAMYEANDRVAQTQSDAAERRRLAPDPENNQHTVRTGSSITGSTESVKPNPQVSEGLPSSIGATPTPTPRLVPPVPRRSQVIDDAPVIDTTKLPVYQPSTPDRFGHDQAFLPWFWRNRQPGLTKLFKARKLGKLAVAVTAVTVDYAFHTSTTSPNLFNKIDISDPTINQPGFIAKASKAVIGKVVAPQRYKTYKDFDYDSDDVNKIAQYRTKRKRNRKERKGLENWKQRRN